MLREKPHAHLNHMRRIRNAVAIASIVEHSERFGHMTTYPSHIRRERSTRGYAKYSNTLAPFRAWYSKTYLELFSKSIKYARVQIKIYDSLTARREDEIVAVQRGASACLGKAAFAQLGICTLTHASSSGLDTIKITLGCSQMSYNQLS